MKRLALVLVIAAVLCAARSLQAHHSFATTYQEDRTRKIEGTLVRFIFRNPHSFVHIDVPDRSGEIHQWAVEWAAAATLTQQGITPLTLQPGDRVRIEGNPGRRAEDYRLRLRQIARQSDGWQWTAPAPAPAP